MKSIKVVRIFLLAFDPIARGLPKYIYLYMFLIRDTSNADWNRGRRWSWSRVVLAGVGVGAGVDTLFHLIPMTDSNSDWIFRLLPFKHLKLFVQ